MQPRCKGLDWQCYNKGKVVFMRFIHPPLRTADFKKTSDMNVKMMLTMKTQPWIRSKEMIGSFPYYYANGFVILTLQSLLISTYRHNLSTTIGLKG